MFGCSLVWVMTIILCLNFVRRNFLRFGKRNGGEWTSGALGVEEVREAGASE